MDFLIVCRSRTRSTRVALNVSWMKAAGISRSLKKEGLVPQPIHRDVYRHCVLRKLLILILRNTKEKPQEKRTLLGCGNNLLRSYYRLGTLATMHIKDKCSLRMSRTKRESK